MAEHAFQKHAEAPALEAIFGEQVVLEDNLEELLRQILGVLDRPVPPRWTAPRPPPRRLWGGGGER